MPFIVQCPHPDCRKYMLLEDAARGTQVECLVCKRLIHVDPSSAEDSAESPPLPHALAEAAMRAQRQRIAHCPQCQGPMRVPPGREGKRIQCPHCKHVFVLGK
jgi:hypothetical protein